MSEPLIERLSRFTPDAGQLDRDALLFNAGRASVRPKRAWGIVAGSLAASQILTLALLWPRPVQLDQTPTIAPGSGVLVQKESAGIAERDEIFVVNRDLVRPDLTDGGEAAALDSLVPSSPPLHAFGSALSMD
jgi:hypothetical protein